MSKILEYIRHFLGRKSSTDLNALIRKKIEGGPQKAAQIEVVVSGQKYRIGDSVCFNDGQTDEDSGADLSGWQGRITDVSEKYKTFGVALDNITLKQLSKEYLEMSEEEGLDWSEYYIEWDCVTKVEPRDIEKEVQATIDKLSSELGWIYLGEDGREINAILKGADEEEDQFELWYNHLVKTLKFPLKARVSEWQEPGRLFKTGQRVKIVGLELDKGFYGVVAKLHGGKSIILADLEIYPTKSSYRNVVHLYAVWFANR